jgi:hypothetical protein
MNATVVGLMLFPTSPRKAMNCFSKVLGLLLVSPELVGVYAHVPEVLVYPEP